MDNPNPEQRDDASIEAKLIQQDHRPFFVLKTFLIRKQWDKEDPRRKAATVAFAWLWLSPAHLAVSGGLATAVITIVLLASQNNLIRDQNGFFRKQIINEDNRARLTEDFLIQSRRTALVNILWNTDPEVILSGRVKSEALLEYIQLEKLLEVKQYLAQLTPEERASAESLNDFELAKIHMTAKSIDLSHADLSNTVLNNADLSLCNFTDANLSNIKWVNANLSQSKLVNCNFNESFVSADFKSCDQVLIKIAESSYQIPKLHEATIDLYSIVTAIDKFYRHSLSGVFGLRSNDESTNNNHISSSIAYGLKSATDNGLLTAPEDFRIDYDAEYTADEAYSLLSKFESLNPFLKEIHAPYSSLHSAIFWSQLHDPYTLKIPDDYTKSDSTVSKLQHLGNQIPFQNRPLDLKIGTLSIYIELNPYDLPLTD